MSGSYQFHLFLIHFIIDFERRAKEKKKRETCRALKLGENALKECIIELYADTTTTTDAMNGISAVQS